MVRDLYRRLRRPRPCGGVSEVEEAGRAPSESGIAPVEAPPSLQTFVLRLPKADLQIPLESTLRPASLLDLAARHALPLPASDEEGIRRWYRATPAEEVDRTCRNALATPGDLHLALLELVSECAVQNVRHAEVTLSVGGALRRGVPGDEQRQAVAEAVSEADGGYGLRLRILAGLRRDEAAEAAGAVVGWAQQCGREVVAGVVLTGPATDSDAVFAPHFRAAAETGLRRAIDLPTDVAAEPLRVAVNELGADRLRLAAASVPGAGRESVIARCSLPTVVCPAELGGSGTAALRSLAAAGTGLSVGSGRSQPLGTNLSREYLRAAALLDLDVSGLEELAAAGFRHAFLEDGDRERELAGLAAEAARLRRRYLE